MSWDLDQKKMAGKINVDEGNLSISGVFLPKTYVILVVATLKLDKWILKKKVDEITKILFKNTEITTIWMEVPYNR